MLLPQEAKQDQANKRYNQIENKRRDELVCAVRGLIRAVGVVRVVRHFSSVNLSHSYTQTRGWIYQSTRFTIVMGALDNYKCDQKSVQ